MTNLKIPLTDPQKRFVKSHKKYPAIIGGLGSGKSRAGTMRILYKLLSNTGIDCAYYMPTYDLINLRAMPGVEADLLSIGIEYRINKSNYSIDVNGFGTVIFRSYDNPNRIIAYEVAHSVCDELDTLKKDQAAYVWRKISERNRQKSNSGNTIALVTSPDQGFNGFAYEKWGKNPGEEYQLIKASTRSNPYLPEDYVDQIMENYDSALAEMYINGDFVNLTSNKVYHFFDRKKHLTDRVLNDKDYTIHVGIDFNIGGCCAATFIIEKGNPVFIDSFVSHDTRDFINNLSRYGTRKVYVYPDATGKNRKTNAAETDIHMIEQAGYHCYNYNANPAVRDRINAVNGLLCHDKILINADKCEQLVIALETQGYDDKGDPEKWNDHPAIDDWADAFGYPIAYKFPIVRPIQRLRTVGL